MLLAGHGERAWAARALVVAAAVAAIGTAGEAHAGEVGVDTRVAGLGPTSDAAPEPGGGSAPAPAGQPGSARAFELDVRRSPGVRVAPVRPSAEDQRRGQRAGFSFDMRLGAGVASVAYDEDDRPIADFEALAFGGAMRFGTFLNPHIVIGAELALSWGSGVGELRVRDRSFFAYDGYPNRATYGSFSPFGVFLEIYPWEEEGLFFGATGGVGFMSLPHFADDEGKGGVMARYALEVGYELGRTGKQGPAVYLRYHRWGGSELPFSEDHPDGLISREVLVGLRWSVWSELWHPARELPGQ